MARDIWNHYKLRRKFTPELFSCIIPDDLTEEDLDRWADGLGLGILEEHQDWLWVREWDGSRTVERPVYLSEELEQRIEGYFRLLWERPELFTPSDHCPIFPDRHRMLTFSEETGKLTGLVFDNSPYYQVISDLHIHAGQLRPYGRVIYPDRQGNGTVIIPRLLREGQEPLFGIIHVFRHSLRAMSGGEFPRGFQAPGITPAENAAKELWEEFRISANHLAALTLLGHTRPDTGLSSGQVQIYLADVTGIQPQANVGHEGIAAYEWLTQEELLHRIRRGEVLDGLTQTAMLLFALHQG